MKPGVFFLVGLVVGLLFSKVSIDLPDYGGSPRESHLQRLPSIAEWKTAPPVGERRLANRLIVIGRDRFSDVVYNLPPPFQDGTWKGKHVDFCQVQPPGTDKEIKWALPPVPHPEIKRCLPSFVVIGALKGGTSSLFTYLMAHPDVTHARKKEVCTLRYEGNPLTDNLDDTYRNLFEGKPTALLASPQDVAYTGEGCPFYLPDGETSASAVTNLLPSARLLLIFRDPVDRILSMFNMRVRYKNDGFKGNERIEDFVKCTRDPLYGNVHCDSSHTGTREFLYEGMYSLQLEKWFAVVPDSPRYIVIKSEDFYADEQGYMDEVFAHMGLSPFKLDPKVLTPKNAAPKDKKFEMHPHLRALLHEFYEPYNKLLYKLLNVDFAWDGGLSKIAPELLPPKPG